MKNEFKNYGIEITDSIADKFESYYNLLIFYNEKFNITAITEKESVIKKHFIDSVKNLLTVVDKGKVIDVGAGGGFPSLPIKIINDKINLTLLEATGKKCEFLKTVVKELNLENVDVINGRAEEIAKNVNYREKFDYVLSRAVAGLNVLSEYCIPFVKVGGYFIAHKGDAEKEIFAAKNAINILGGKIEKIDEFYINDAKRSLIFIKKIKNTDKKYPRGNGKERKNPL